MGDDILLVDDDPGTIRVLATILADLGNLSSRVKHLADEMRRVAATDGFTGVASRRRFDESPGREWNSARRAGDGLALLTIDRASAQDIAGTDTSAPHPIAAGVRRPSPPSATRFGGPVRASTGAGHDQELK